MLKRYTTCIRFLGQGPSNSSLMKGALDARVPGRKSMLSFYLGMEYSRMTNTHPPFYTRKAHIYLLSTC